MASDDLLPVKLETLFRLDDGAVAEAFNRNVEIAAGDCENRPADDRVRRITLELQVKPVKQIRENAIFCDGARCICKVRLTLPDRETRTLDFGVRKTRHGGLFVFSELEPTNHRQTHLPLEEGDEQ